VTRFVAGSASLVGQVRPANEDALLVIDDLVAVADGMGGHQAGEVASAETVEVLSGAVGERSLEDLVIAVQRANRQVHARAASDDELRGMGTTVCVAGLVRYDGADEVAVLNVGDSRVYLLADGELSRLTEDHSLVEALVREGRLTEAEAEVHPQRNVLTRALGVEPLVVVDAWLLAPADGDRLLLCSDGLFNELSEQRIAELLSAGEEPELTARRLAAEAESAGGRDNISVVVVDLVDTGRPSAPLTDRYRRVSTPAVDLSEPDDGPRTETRLAPVVAPAPTEDPGADPSPNDDPVAGDAVEDASADPGGGTAHLDGEPGGPADPDADADDGDRTSRVRSALFFLAVVATVAVAAVLIVGALLQDDPAPRPPTFASTTLPPSISLPPTTATTTTTTTIAAPVDPITTVDPSAPVPPADAIPVGP
jgi:serine/threonine protein phosphatase PrpC